MLEDFLSYIESNLSVFREDKLLLSVSGGIDSMVMLHLFRQLAYNIEIAHINHSTRNGKSDEDMAFVMAYCERHSIPFHSKTLNYTELSKGNFQDNARRERFLFLSEVKEALNCKWIATAHHKDDRWETFLMHLNRKSGLKGLTSLRARENEVIHPLLFTTKAQIVSYSKANNIEYAHDESNDERDYLRNAIRHQVTPEIVQLMPDFIENVNQSILHLDGTAALLQELIDSHELVSTDSQTGYAIVSLEKIKSYSNQIELLFFTIEKYGFNHSTASDILSTVNTGAKFESTDYEALYDRGKLIIRKKRSFQKTNLTIESPGIYQLPNSEKKLKVEINPTEIKDTHLWIAFDRLKWPLLIRNVEPGDAFKPQGMQGATKTIKKLCTDLKIDRFTKEDLLVVCEEGNIIQIIGIRTRHEYTTDDIKNALTFNIVD